MLDRLANLGFSNTQAVDPLVGISLFGTSYSLTTIILGTGTIILSATLLVMMLSRWGEARPVAKCVGLSILAHILLVVYAYSTNMLQPSGPAATQQAISVQMIEEGPEETRTIDDWEQADSNFVPDTAPPEDFNHTDFSNDDFSLPPDPSVASESDVISETSPLPAEVWDETDLPVPDEPFDSNDVSPIEADTRSDREPNDADTVIADAFANASQADNPSPVPGEADSSPPPDATAVNNTLADVPNVAEDAEALSSDQDAIAEAASEQAAVVRPTAPRSAPRRPINAQVVARTKQLPNKYKARANERSQVATEQGGGEETEAAVDDALAWLASVQSSDGRWDASAHSAGRNLNPRDTSRNNSGVKADTAITSLALLAFMGAGHTHRAGPYRENVQFGLEFLLRTSKASRDGSLAGDANLHAKMYCHGISTLALSEAYIMTQDRRLLPFLQNAVRYTLNSQNLATGGWRYRPGEEGDTSQFGWQLMSLMSARTAGLDVPEQRVNLMHRWLSRVSTGPNNELARYKPSRVPTKAMTAEALVCRLFLDGRKDHRAIDAAADYLSQAGIGGGQLNLYYCYYGTLGLYQMQDERWQRWNQELKAELLPRQRRRGSLAGSWDPNTVWGQNGGRVYTTSLATLCLETYYRYLPFYDLPEDRTARLNSLRRSPVNR